VLISVVITKYATDNSSVHTSIYLHRAPWAISQQREDRRNREYSAKSNSAKNS